jgi:hypothetical protein
MRLHALVLALASGTASAEQVQPFAADWPAGHAICRPVPLNCVEARGFLGRRIKANVRSILEGLKSPIPRGFEARAAGREPGPETRRLAADSDLYKWLEGAAYVAAATGDKDIRHVLDRIVGLVLACQKPDGYINTQVPPNVRFDPRINHDLYTAGHFFEAAVAHYRSTGDRRLLDAAARWADYLLVEYTSGNPYFANVARREHSEYELGLLRLGRATGNPKYIDFAARLAKLIPVGPPLFEGEYAGRGHAVRINYLLTGYADLYLETGRNEFKGNLESLWDEILNTRSYVTGGVSVIERYPVKPYELPQSMDHPSRDIAETCTSVSLAMFAWRLHGMSADSHYFDQIETILYNHYLGGVSLDHLGTFYYNPLRLTGEAKGKTDHGGPAGHRTRLPAIHSTSCCISNEWRFFGALSEYLYSYDDRGLYVNLYTSSRVMLPGRSGTAVVVETNYPHTGDVLLRVEGRAPERFALRLRIPKWAQSASVAVGKERRRSVAPGQYAVLDRTWRPGDAVHLRLEMPVRAVLPPPEDRLNQGQAALARGPLVYCLEQLDAGFPVEKARWAGSPAETARRTRVAWKPELLDGVNVLDAPGIVDGKKTRLMLIPFYARANRAQDNRWVTLIQAPRRE